MQTNENIVSFKKHNKYTSYKEKDATERDIGYTHLTHVSITGRNSFYPNVLLNLPYEKNKGESKTTKFISPYDEKIMSLNKDGFYDGNVFSQEEEEEEEKPINRENSKKEIFQKSNYFFFIYNFENYYHFLYDTLPYLHTFLHIKNTIAPDLKLLVNYPNPTKKEFYKFNLDFLETWKDDIVLHNPDNNNNNHNITTVYENLYVSTSLTHGGYSNNPPRKEVYEFFHNSLYSKKNTINSGLKGDKKRIYVSRRTWINNDRSNIGTDYTTRRKMMNEDELVLFLTEKYGFEEVFTENLSTDEKVNLFSNAEIVCGSIGGGMSNLLFSPPTTKSIVLVTPFFLDINNRFRYSMEHTDIHYFTNIETYYSLNDTVKEKVKHIPLYCRAKITDPASTYYNRIGEICDLVVRDLSGSNSIQYLLNLSNNDVAGFRQNGTFTQEWFFPENFELLDRGLNSPYLVDIEALDKLLLKII